MKVWRIAEVSGQLVGDFRAVVDILKMTYTVEDSEEFFTSFLRVYLEFYSKER
jgi:hypothetical protein